MKTLAIVLEENKDLIVAFHIGKGGRYYNGGHLSYIGEMTINNFTNDLFLSENESEYLDANGEKVGLLVENDGIGRIDIDGEYDTIYSIKVSDLNEKEIQAILNIGSGWYGIFAQELSEVTETEIED